MPLIILALGIVLLVFLLVKCKLNGFVSLLLASLFVALANGMPLNKIIGSIEGGMGPTLGHLGIILGLGAMFGRLLADSGAAQRIAETLINKFGEKNAPWAIGITGFVVGVTLFWEVSFVIMIPITLSVARAAKAPLLKCSLPMIAGISVTHCFLPPHPGPVAVAQIFKADIGLVLAYGLILAIPAVIACALYYLVIKKWDKGVESVPAGLMTAATIENEVQMPGFGISLFTAFIPVIIILGKLFTDSIVAKDSFASQLFAFIGSTDMAMIIAYVFALFALGIFRGMTMKELMKSAEDSIKGIAMILLIIGGGGAFMKVIIDTGVGTYVAKLCAGLSLSPILLAWFITAIIRLCVGSATVSLFTAAGIVAPIVASTGANPQLVVLAMCSGSFFLMVPQDPSFWMLKEYFSLSFGQMCKSFGAMAGIISVTGLLGVLILNMFI